MMSVKISCIVTGTSIVPQMNVVMSRACKGCCVTYTPFKGFVWELNNFVLFYLFIYFLWVLNSSNLVLR